MHELLSLFAVSDLTIDETETARLRSEARRGVASIKRIFAKDDVIIDKNAPVTQDHADALDALADRIAKEQTSHPIRRLIQIVAAATITGFLIFVFGYFLATCEQTTFNQPSQLILLALLTIATAAIASYIKTHELDIYLVPAR